MNKGFALIEMIIYTALFSIMMGGLIVTVYQLQESSKHTESGFVTQEEINFVYKKIDWVLNSVEKINSPTLGISSTLSIDKRNFTDNPIIIRFNSSEKKIEYCTGVCTDAADFTQLTSSNIEVNDLSFKHSSRPNNKAPTIETTANIDNKVFTFIKYIENNAP